MSHDRETAEVAFKSLIRCSRDNMVLSPEFELEFDARKAYTKTFLLFLSFKMIANSDPLTVR